MPSFLDRSTVSAEGASNAGMIDAGDDPIPEIRCRRSDYERCRARGTAIQARLNLNRKRTPSPARRDAPGPNGFLNDVSIGRARMRLAQTAYAASVETRQIACNVVKTLAPSALERQASSRRPAARFSGCPHRRPQGLNNVSSTTCA